MTDERHSEVLGGLPRTRPHRRSDKRAATPVTPAASDGAAQASPPAKAKLSANAKPAAKAKPAVKKPQAAAKPKKPATKPGAKRSESGARLRQPAQPEGTPTRSRAKSGTAPRPPARTSASPKGTEILGTAVQAAAEIAEIGISAGARAIRRAVSRLPRP
jgi:hypothetical protein